MAAKIPPHRLEDHHNPMARFRNEDTVELMALFISTVGKAIDEELSRRDIRPGSFCAIHCTDYRESPTRLGITFDIHFRGPDDVAIEFRGTQ